MCKNVHHGYRCPQKPEEGDKSAVLEGSEQLPSERTLYTSAPLQSSPTPILFVVVFLLGIGPRATCMLAQHSTNELYSPWPSLLRYATCSG